MPTCLPFRQWRLASSPAIRHSTGLPAQRALTRIAIATLALGACSGGDGLLLPSEGEPADIVVLRGDAQQGRVGEPLSDPLVFEVTDSRSRPVAGATVSFDLTSAAPGAQVIPQTATTDANGIANVQMVLGTSIGQQTGTARVAMGAGKQVPEVSFTAVALPENANVIAPVAGEDQTGRVGSPLADRLVVKVTDAFDNPIPGVPISWSAEGGGSVSETLVNTDEQGLASVERILGPATGQQTTIANSEGLAGSPVTFVHTALAGDASLLTIVSGDNQTGQAGSELAAELVIRLVDGAGNGVSQTPVAWVVAIGGGSIVSASSVTDGDGLASARWVLGPTPGANRLDAVVSGVGVASFDALATPGAPAALSVRTQPPSTARNGVVLDRDPVVQLLDAGGNPVSNPGVQVAVALGSGGGSLTGTRQRLTDGNGQATFSDLAISGAPGSYTLVFASSGYASTTSSTIDLKAVSTTTTIISDVPDPTAPGSTFTVEFRVSSEGPTPTGTVTISDGVESCNGTLSNGVGRCDLALTTPGNRTLRATYPGGPGLDGSSDTEGHQVQPTPPANTAPTADYTSSCMELTCRFTDRSSDPDGSISSRSWNFGDGSSGSSEKDPLHTFPSAGTYTVTLGVTDNGGATASTSNQVTVSQRTPPANKPPNADFEARCTDLACSFTDRSKDNDGTVTTWLWSFGDGTGSSDKDPSHTFAASGTYTVTLSVTDNGGATANTSKQVTVNQPPNKAPQADFEVHCSDLDCGFTDKSKDDDGFITAWQWDFGDGQGSSDQSPSHSYASPGKYQVTLTVTDNGGASDSRTHDVDAKAPPPASTSVTITSDAPDPSDFGAPVSVSFTVTSPAGTPSGIVTISEPNGGSCTGNAPSGSCTLSPGGSGKRNITAAYEGDPSFSGSSDTEEHTVQEPPPAQTTTTITSDTPDPTDQGAEFTVLFSVTSGSGVPSGSVTVTDGVDSCTGTLAGDGTGSCPITLTTTGTRTLTATYGGNSSFAGSSDQETHEVTAPPAQMP